MNNTKALHIKLKPSQLLNLPVFLLGILLIPGLFLLDELLKLYLPVDFVPDKFERYILNLPVFLAVLFAGYLGYYMLKIYCIRYEISSEELRHYSGILNRKHEFIEHYRIKDFAVDRPLIYRLFGLGNLTIYTSDKTTPVFKMEAIKHPQDIYKTLRDLVEQNRREKHVFEVD
ncbi:PH domain-containing protein [Sunxiuqinia elliptica]|uniref:PH (Pleckstrin Homology) domain-containing protein n=1 Tax=Sunxiuqinia elliptica TaxID=655355 RepID=A0A4R6HCF0_9BACT|nr:PH domain-containing protein [Sunxiuqinia elliptica]TDO05385.1 PH (Pleckstrin Homology) domain-containing protein [Sunxiuqinia elliptica]TDO64932.1 PH (Pleckstrin Homology) domain-containing protein [Sunxiuqinia elliptica]